jgi:hypothetical protein
VDNEEVDLSTGTGKFSYDNMTLEKTDKPDIPGDEVNPKGLSWKPEVGDEVEKQPEADLDEDAIPEKPDVGEIVENGIPINYS